MKNSFVLKIAIKFTFSLCLLVFLTPLHAWCQAIYIGQNSEEVKLIINSEIQSYNRAQGYKQVKMDYRTDYTNGQLNDVVICKENVPMIDLRRTGDFCTHYIMNKGRLSHILTQYSNISLEDLEEVMSKGNIRIGKYYFGDDPENYSIVYLSSSGKATKEFRNVTFNPLPANIQNQLNTARQKKEKVEIVKDDYSNAIQYKGFETQNIKIFWKVLDGFTYKDRINKVFIKNTEPSIKAILGFYSGICNSFQYTETLNIGGMCSNELINYVAKHFKKDKSILEQISHCSTRAFSGEYSLNALEMSQDDKIITVSYSMTYFEDNKSKDDIVGVDKFQINSDNSITAIQLSSKESLVKKIETINSKSYNVQEVDPNAYEKFKLDLKNEFLKVLKAGNYKNPSFDELLKRMDRANFLPSWSISNNYDIDWRTIDNSRDGRRVGNTWVAGSDGVKFIQDNTLNKGNDYEYQLLKSCRVYMPTIKIDGIDPREKILIVKNIEVDFEKGITFVKVKSDNAEYVKYPPSQVAMGKIKAKLIGVPKGTYLVKYEFGKVMGDNYENISFEKVKSNNSWMTTVGAIGLGIL